MRWRWRRGSRRAMTPAKPGQTTAWGGGEVFVEITATRPKALVAAPLGPPAMERQSRFSACRAALTRDERCDAVDAIEILHPGLVRLHLNAVALLDEADQAQGGHRIQNPTGSQRRVVPQVGGLFAGQEFGKNVLPDLFFYVVHVCSLSLLMPSANLKSPNTSQSSCAGFP